MKKLLIVTFLLLNLITFAQRPCEFSTDVTDSIGTYKTTKEYLIFESNFSTTKE